MKIYNCFKPSFIIKNYIFINFSFFLFIVIE